MTTRRLTIGELVDWVIKNRRGKVFDGWTPIQIASQIADGAENNTVFCSIGSDGVVDGIVCANKYRGHKTIFIMGILTTKRGALRCLLKMLSDHYIGWRVEAERRGRKVVYNNLQLVSKFGLLHSNHYGQ